MNKNRLLPLPLIVDSTVVLNFGKIGKFYILDQLYGSNMIIPTDVKIEVSTDKIIGPLLEDRIKDGICEEYMINYECNNKEIKDYIELRKRFGHGEAACLSISKNWKCTIATDDMRAAKAYCMKNKISLIGTLGILFEAYNRKIISEKEGQDILDDMIKVRKYSSPVSQFNEVIKWFEEGEGRELF